MSCSSKRYLLVLGPAFLALCLGGKAQEPEDLVHPLTGTANEGQTYPAAGVPFAMTHWTPQTRAGETKCVSPYYYNDSRIQGIRGTHFLSGSCVPDYGSLTLMPGTGTLHTDAVGRSSGFDRKTEHAAPYAYSVELRDAHAIASVTATARCALLRFEFTSDQPDAWVVLENNSRAGDGSVAFDAVRNEVRAEVRVRREYIGSGKPAGFSSWFLAQIDQPVKAAGTFVGAAAHDGVLSQSGDGMVPAVIPLDHPERTANTAAPRPGFGTFLHFGAVHRGQVIQVRVGSSFVSLEEARHNLEAEIPDWDFARVEQAARSAWHDRLGRVHLAGSDPARSIFYTALYHALLHPRTISDVSGGYPRFSDHGTPEHTEGGRPQFDDYSMWDTFRAQSPLLTILDDKLQAALMQSIVNKGTQGGFLPIFPAWGSYTSEMIGDHSIAMMADAWQKGVRGFEIEQAYQLMRHNALELPKNPVDYLDGKGRRGLDSYLRYGFLPLEDHMAEAFHRDEQVSRTLEYAYDDAMLGTLAQSLGHADDAALFRQRGENWRNVIDPQTGFARGRHSDGSWVREFDPAAHVSWITEGLPWQYTFFVPQDVPGLIALEGGSERFVAKLDELFARGYYDHGNEPSHHIAYLYTVAGSPAKTQQHVRALLESEYHDAPGGLAGNDDAGQMSAWYVLSALGLYPVCPGRPEYTLTSPRFDDVTLKLTNGRTLHIIAPGAEKGFVYARFVSLNGKPLPHFTLSHAELMEGGTLRFDMTQSFKTDTRYR